MNWSSLTSRRSQLYKVLLAGEQPPNTVWVTADEFEQIAREAGINERTVNSLRSDFEFMHRVIEVNGQPLAMGRPT